MGVRRAAAALLLLTAPAVAAGADLVVSGPDGELARHVLPDGRWCLVWNHSVTGIEVADCFRADSGMLVLESSLQPDYAAGLGEVPGRGRAVAVPGGTRIEGIDEPLPDGLVLRRAGPRVHHRLRIGAAVWPLPGERGERLVIRLERGG